MEPQRSGASQPARAAEGRGGPAGPPCPARSEPWAKAAAADATLHPLVAQVDPSREQRPAVTLRGCDIAVTAGAGTGKTRTLVARYLSLLAEGLPLRSIVAITFTRKAAREMRNRVREEIRRYLDSPELDERERHRWQQLYSALDAARIDTIHSLCGEILRAHPAEAAVDPRFETLDEGQGNILLGRVVDEALARAADHPDLVGLFALMGERDLRDTLAAMLSSRLDVAACLENMPLPIWPVWEARLLEPVRAFVDSPLVGTNFQALLAIRDTGAVERAEAAGDRLAGPLRSLLDRWQEVVACRAREDWVSLLGHLPPLRGQMSSYGRAANWRPHEPKGHMAQLRTLYDALVKDAIGKGMDLERERELAGALPRLHSLFATACQAYERMKEERQALDFDDLEVRALALVRDNAAVRARWQADVQALLVDEFQDTNGRQRDLVALLNGERGRLFIVGDAKQSIYRFRGADVVVFRQERERIAARGGAALPLETSYRAHKGLIEALNNLLRPVLGEDADPDRPWAEPFARLRHHRERPGPGFHSPYVELHLTTGSKSGGALDQAATAVAARIMELVAGDVMVEEEGRARPLEYSDVAILCRASTSFSAYEDALERAGVPFLTVSGRGFYGRAEVRDLLNALQALADPTDDLCLAGLLRSPACALSDEGLVHLCAEREARGTSLWDVLRQGHASAALAESDLRCAQRAAGLVSTLHDQVGRTPVADVLKAFLDATGIRAALIQAGHTRAARNVSKLLADAHASGIVGVGEFLEYITGLRDTGTREGEARSTAEGAVQILTVHAAKGLEFPVVIIGDITRAGGRSRGPLRHPELGLLVPVRDEERSLPAIYRLGKVLEDDQEAAESDRLLYVAATRARELLILSGCVGLKRDNSFRQPAGWLGRLCSEEGLQLGDFERPFDPEGAGVHRLDLRAGPAPVTCAIYEPGWPAIPLSLPAEGRALDGRTPEDRTAARVALPPPLLAPVLPEVEPVDEGVRALERVPVQRVWRVAPAVKRPRAPAWVIGSLVHEALAAWRFPDEQAGTGGGPTFSDWALARSRSYGLTDGRQLKDALRRTRTLLLRFRSHPLYQDMNGAARRLHEVPYSLVVDGRVESGIIDALFQRDGSWTLVEFKTDRLRDQDELERTLQEEGYLAQAARYRAAVETLLGQTPEIMLCLLNLAGAVAIRRVAPERA